MCMRFIAQIFCRCSDKSVSRLLFIHLSLLCMLRMFGARNIAFAIFYIYFVGANDKV